IRIGTATLAVALLFFFQPSIHAAWRLALDTPAAARETRYQSGGPDGGGRPLSEFESGVFAMQRAVIDVSGGYAATRWITVAALFWLACSPAFKRQQARRTISPNSPPAATNA
ncbi:MAG: hypothetical protein ACREND_12195, partial [Gemmatimonadaceae bacterium]